MKKIAVAFFPLLMFGFLLPETGNHPLITTNMTSATPYDGPYVIYKNDQVFIKTVFDDGGIKSTTVDSVSISQKATVSLTVATDESGKTFTVQLKNQLQNEKSEYKRVDKQAVISDIEGNFGAFRKLLQNTGVIDANYNWTFGDGHLVLTGDFFDRGDHVTEVLWLIYSLEDKAKAAGGYVHFVLGNHEIMNISGDIRYLHAKYLQSASILNEDYVAGLYGANSELGRWLRTKNIVEKVGNILFAHGGISAEMNLVDASINKINELARPYYPDTTYQYSDPRTEIIYSDWGPFWYRGYYQGKTIASKAQVDSTLEKYNVKKIATGHTVIADTISVLFGGKLINTDVHHAKGHSEALLIEGGKYYRITLHGEKFLIME